MNTNDQILIILAVLGLFFIYKFSFRNKNKEDEVIKIEKIGFKHDTSLSSEDNYKEYIKLAAKKEKINKDQVFDFFVKNHEKLKLSYVYETCKILHVNNIIKLFEKAEKEILEDPNY